MYFTVLNAGAKPPAGVKSRSYLIMDDSDDWNKFTTQYTLIICDSQEVAHIIGAVKIGQFQMQEGQRRAAIPEEFESLSEEFFSLGQDDTYYEQLNARNKATRETVLIALRDIAADALLFEKAKHETVTTESLLRSVAGVTAQGQFRRLAKGGERLTSYQFKYTGPKPTGEHADGSKPVEVTFEVDPDSHPPSNIHVLIGPNGVGKTRVLELMARALFQGEGSSAQNGIFEKLGNTVGHTSFAGVVSVTFSAFDPFEPLPDRRGETEGIRYSYVGLKSTSKNVTSGTPKNLKTLTIEFSKSLEKCSSGPRAERWQAAVRTLEADPIFKAANIASLIDGYGDDDGIGTQGKVSADKVADDATELFLNLSTGHKIVLLTITRLIETVEERTLVLFDEPESHLHPPLLSAFIRALSDLLINRNGVAIIATHSPVVLQEVPKSCAWKLRRNGNIVHAERPEAETFGENLSVLTREVFGLEVTHSGFHKLLLDAVESENDFDVLLARFGGQLGAEARALARVLLVTKPRNG